MNIVPTKLKTGDEVVVVTGKDKGKKGTLRKILKAKNKGFVTGINMVKKTHQTKSRNGHYWWCCRARGSD